MSDPGFNRPGRPRMQTWLLALLAVVIVLVVINVFRHLRGDPLERARLNPEERPRTEDVMAPKSPPPADPAAR